MTDTFSAGAHRVVTDTFSAGAHRVRAKVYVSEVAQLHRGRALGGPDDGKVQIAERVTFSFVSGNDPDSENAKFWLATPEAQPWGMTIHNSEAQGIFRAGQEYYVDFVEAIRHRSG